MSQDADSPADTPADTLADALRVVRAEAQALSELAARLDTSETLRVAVAASVSTILATRGHLVVAGVGKSGHVGQKLAASFASTGTPAFFMHPTEASHGDLGMVTDACTLLALSYSGESHELLDALRYARKVGAPVVGVTARADSTLARLSDTVLVLPLVAEACPNGLAPTTSTALTLAMGDALVVATMTRRGFTPESFGARHPGGRLGRGLHTVGEWMEANPAPPPMVTHAAGAADVVSAVSSGQHGCVAVVDAKGVFVGMITDGDLRRAMTPGLFDRTAADIMTADPLTLSVDMRMRDVVAILSERRLSNAFVVRNGQPVAVVDMKTLVQQGYL